MGWLVNLTFTFVLVAFLQTDSVIILSGIVDVYRRARGLAILDSLVVPRTVVMTPNAMLSRAMWADDPKKLPYVSPLPPLLDIRRPENLRFYQVARRMLKRFGKEFKLRSELMMIITALFSVLYLSVTLLIQGRGGYLPLSAWFLSLTLCCVIAVLGCTIIVTLISKRANENSLNAVSNLSAI